MQKLTQNWWRRAQIATGVLCGCLALNAFGVAGDRLVFEMNNTHYSQRQLETYLFLKRALMVNSAGAVTAVDAPSWSAALRQFQDDMLVEQETQRLGGFQPSENMIKTAQAVVDKKLAADAGLQAVAHRLGVDERTKVRMLGSILRIESFRRSRERQQQQSVQASSPAKKDTASATPPATGSDWVRDLEQRATIRFYQGAKSYQPIAPVSESESH